MAGRTAKLNGERAAGYRPALRISRIRQIAVVGHTGCAQVSCGYLAMESWNLNVAVIEETRWTTGPGCFLTVWVQGCDRRCPGCVNESFQPIVSRTLMNPGQIIGQLKPGIHEGICFSGGEPFLQAGVLAETALQARRLGYGVVAYSGYTLAELQADPRPETRQLLDNVDLLIDGPYLQEQTATLLWRGSHNQKIHFLTSRYPRPVLNHPPVTEVRADSREQVVTGLPNPALRLLTERLSQWGLNFGEKEIQMAAKEHKKRTETDSA